MPNPLEWEFLKEPLWRWFLFMLALGLMLNAWRSVLNEMS
jgi:hypothetical protein